ncbi:MAG: hypothetical protein KatS3mg090_0565 [Patescibacteria group bacterium]|nr:MAG: hypothetical protein KatS3mg090_0565 [Patescibacteria group bacterium]
MDSISLLKEKIKKLSQKQTREKESTFTAKKTLTQSNLEHSVEKNEIQKQVAEVKERVNQNRNLDSVLYEWRSPLRPYKRFNFKILRFFIAFTLLISLLLYFFNAYTLLLTFLTIVFLIFAFLITPPPTVVNRISLFGIETGDLILRWEDFSFFYVEKKLGFYIINLFLLGPIASKIMLVVESEEDKDKIVEILSIVLPYKKNIKHGFFDKLFEIFDDLIADNEATSKKVVLP